MPRPHPHSFLEWMVGCNINPPPPPPPKKKDKKTKKDAEPQSEPMTSKAPPAPTVEDYLSSSDEASTPATATPSAEGLLFTDDEFDVSSTDSEEETRLVEIAEATKKTHHTSSRAPSTAHEAAEAPPSSPETPSAKTPAKEHRRNLIIVQVDSDSEFDGDSEVHVKQSRNNAEKPKKVRWAKKLSSYSNKKNQSQSSDSDSDSDSEKNSNKRGGSKQTRESNQKQQNNNNNNNGKTQNQNASSSNQSHTSQNHPSESPPKMAKAYRDLFYEGLTEQEKKSKTPATDRYDQLVAERSREFESRGLVMPRSEVVVVENVVETIGRDPRPNAFYDSDMKMLRVYHGPTYGNPHDTLMPRNTDSLIGTQILNSAQKTAYPHFPGLPQYPPGWDPTMAGMPQYGQYPTMPGGQMPQQMPQVTGFPPQHMVMGTPAEQGGDPGSHGSHGSHRSHRSHRHKDKSGQQNGSGTTFPDATISQNAQPVPSATWPDTSISQQAQRSSPQQNNNTNSSTNAAPGWGGEQAQAFAHPSSNNFGATQPPTRHSSRNPSPRSAHLKPILNHPSPLRNVHFADSTASGSNGVKPSPYKPKSPADVLMAAATSTWTAPTFSNPAVESAGSWADDAAETKANTNTNAGADTNKNGGGGGGAATGGDSWGGASAGASATTPAPSGNFGGGSNDAPSGDSGGAAWGGAESNNDTTSGGNGGNDASASGGAAWGGDAPAAESGNDANASGGAAWGGGGDAAAAPSGGGGW